MIARAAIALALVGLGLVGAALRAPNNSTAVMPTRAKASPPSTAPAPELVAIPAAEAPAILAASANKTGAVDRVESTVTTLASVLEEPSFDRYRWERAVAALGARLPDRSIDDLARIASSTADPNAALGAAAVAALLHERSTSSRAAPAVVVSTLRNAWAEPLPSARVAAAGPGLIRCGEPSDLRAIASDLACDDSRRRGQSLWALRAARGEELVRELCALLASPAPHDIVCRTLAALRVGVQGAAPLSPTTRELAEQSAVRWLEAEGADARLVARSRSVLEALESCAPEGARYSTFNSGVK